MASPVLACTDGSDLSLAAVGAGLAVVGSGAPVVLVTAMEGGPEPGDLVGSGHAGPAMTPEQADELHAQARTEAEQALDRAAATLGLPDAERRLVEGAVGPALCALATELDAAAIVLGTRGRGGLRRAVLGSVSDHVVRNAPCTVVVTPPAAVDDEG